MPHFFTGDELGNIKLLSATKQQAKEWVLKERLVHSSLPQSEAEDFDTACLREHAVQRLSSLVLQDTVIVRAHSSSS